MPIISFRISARNVTPDGIRLFMSHAGCDKQATIFFADTDELKSQYDLKCPCGVESPLYFSSPELGRRLIEELKRPENDFEQGSEPSPN